MARPHLSVVVDNEGQVHDGFCECGCGQRTELATRNMAARGWVKGKPKRFIHGHNATKSAYWWVDKQTGCWEWTGAKNKAGYGMKWLGRVGSNVRAHRWVFVRERGPIPHDRELDHICQNRACVNPDHLRVVTHAENGQNLPARGRGSSEYRGVSWCKQTGRWAASVTIGGKAHWIGRFDTQDAAASAAASYRAWKMPYSQEVM